MGCVSSAYGIGILTVLVAAGASAVYYQDYYLPESLAKPSVPHGILEAGTLEITIIPGALEDNGLDYVPKEAEAVLGTSNRVVWVNEDGTAHTVTPDHRHADPYSGEFGSPGVIRAGESYEFLFTEAAEIHYHCEPHPWMEATIKVQRDRF